jgi:hypothetical protein
VALWSNPPHRVSTYRPTVSDDGGGGDAVAFALVQAAVKCLINTASASTVEMYAADQIRVSHTVAFKASALTTALARGMKLVADDTSESLHVEGIRTGRAMGSIPALIYADCSSIL